ncbi:MAG: PadR family transcriptional regulator [Actinomycetota bacterium]|nr:PadR family transcriptional regulator [Actinomycetota bacterium]
MPAAGRPTLAGPPLFVLMSLASGPKHGHALMKDITGFAMVRLGPGTLYGAIGRLEDRGLIAAMPADDRRRPYELTSEGAAVLEASVAELRQIADEGASRLAILARARRRPRPSLGAEPA